MIIPKFCTEKELDPFTAAALNTRFFGFLQALSVRMDLHRQQLLETAVDILRDAEIPQPGDELLGEEEQDLTPFNL